MENKKEFKIIFMDDEIDIENEVPNIAYKELVKAGYQVDKVDKISDVISSIFKKYYDLYILDIDMSKIEDYLLKEKVGDEVVKGSTLGEILKRINSISTIVIYSARGDINDWFKSANYHFYRYISKKGDNNEDSVKQLINVVDEIYQKNLDEEDKYLKFENKMCPKNALVYYKENNFVKRDFIEEKIKKLNFKVDFVDKLKKFKENLNKNIGVGVIIADEFPYTDEIIEYFRDILKNQPEPHIIICIAGKNEDRGFILEIINLNPFRFLNLKESNINEQLEDAIDNAIKWYGENEIFKMPDSKYIVNKPLTDEELEYIRKKEEELGWTSYFDMEENISDDIGE